MRSRASPGSPTRVRAARRPEKLSPRCHPNSTGDGGQSLSIGSTVHGSRAASRPESRGRWNVKLCSKSGSAYSIGTADSRAEAFLTASCAASHGCNPATSSTGVPRSRGAPPASVRAPSSGSSGTKGRRRGPAGRVPAGPVEPSEDVDLGRGDQAPFLVEHLQQRARARHDRVVEHELVAEAEHRLQEVDGHDAIEVTDEKWRLSLPENKASRRLPI